MATPVLRPSRKSFCKKTLWEFQKNNSANLRMALILIDKFWRNLKIGKAYGSNSYRQFIKAHLKLEQITKRFGALVSLNNL